MPTYITGAKIVLPSQVLENGTLEIDHGKIIAAYSSAQRPLTGGQVIQADGLWLTPGLIDIHVHGANRADVMDASPESLHTMAKFFASHGVTSFLPTTMSDTPERILAALKNISSTPQPQDGSAHLGAHIEGPFLSAKYRGAQPEKTLRNPNRDEFDAWLSTGSIRLVTIAPELPGAQEMIAYGVSKGVEFSAGHSAASYDELLRAADLGLRQGTHTFNGMSGLHHRQPGIVGAILSDDRIYAQMIADGEHLHPAVVKLIIRAKGIQRTILITDAMEATGCPDGAYTLGGEPVNVVNHIARTPIGGLAGSTLTLDQAVKNVMRFADLSFPEAVSMATSVPAEAMHLNQKGFILPGYDADLTLFDAALQVKLTMLGGRIVYKE